MIRKKLNNNGQLFIVAGVIITIMIVVSAIVTIDISSVTRPIDKSNFIKNEFENIKADFGYYINDILTTEVLEDNAELQKIFDDSNSLFKFAEARHNYYFNAKLILPVLSYSDKKDTLKVEVTLSDSDDSISEVVYYFIK